MTKAMIEIAGLLGIAVRDHVIVAKNGACEHQGAAADLVAAKL